MNASFLQKFLPVTTAGRFLFCLLAGCIAGGAMGPLYLWYNLIFALSFFWLIVSDMSKSRSWKSFTAGWLFGFGYFVFGLYWIGNALLVEGNPYKWAYPLAVAGLPAILALYPALSTWAARMIHGGRDGRAFLVFMFSTMLFEYLRARLFTGFPWNLYGMAWTGHPEILQFLSIGGIHILSFLTVFICLAPAFAIAGKSHKSLRYATLVLAIATIAGLYIFGEWRLERHPTTYRDDVIVQLVQPNIPQSEKWDSSLMWDNYRETINLLRIDPQIKSQAKHPIRVLVLPETSLTYHHLDEPAAMDALRGAIGHFPEEAYLLSGALLRDKDGYHNSLIALNKTAEQVYSFDKFHLVPFGEYIPFQKYIPLGPVTSFSGFVEGPGPQTAMIGSIPPFSPLVCYEVIFAGEVTSDNPQRPEWIVNVTNDAWYGVSAGPFQHLAHAIYRAIEEGVPVVRVANTGVSTVIDPYGRVLTVIPLNSRYTEEIFLPKPAIIQPLYSRLKNF